MGAAGIGEGDEIVSNPFQIFRVSIPDGEYSRRADVVEKCHFDAEHALRLEAERKFEAVQDAATRSAMFGAENLNKALDRADEAERQVGELREQFAGAESDARDGSVLLSALVEWVKDGFGGSERGAELLRKSRQWINESENKAEGIVADLQAKLDTAMGLLTKARWRLANTSRSEVPFNDPLDGPVLRGIDAFINTTSTEGEDHE